MPLGDEATKSVQTALERLPSGLKSEPYKNLRAALQELNQSHRAYCDKFDRRAAKRQREREAEQKELVDRAAHFGDEDPLDFAAVQNVSEKLDDFVDHGDRLLHTLADNIVIAAAASTYSQDAVERSEAVIGSSVNIAINLLSIAPGLGTPAAIAATGKELNTLKANLNKKKQIAAEDADIAHLESATVAIQFAAQAIRSFRDAIT